jgi:hypothetical protein
MTVYKSHDPARQATSQRYQDGAYDGREDALTMSQCPPGSPLGPNTELSSSWMYRQGYEDNFTPWPCDCDGSCKKNGRKDSEDDTQ